MKGVAINIYCTAIGMKICLFREKAKTNSNYIELAKQEANQAIRHVELCEQQLKEANESAVGHFVFIGQPGGEFPQYRINVDGTSFVYGFPSGTDLNDERDNIVSHMNRATDNDIVLPCKEIIGKIQKLG